MKWTDLSTTTQIASWFLGDLGNPNKKSTEIFFFLWTQNPWRYVPTSSQVWIEVATTLTTFDVPLWFVVKSNIFFHKLSYFSFHVVPPINLSKIRIYLNSTRMHCLKWTMRSLQYLPFNKWIIRHTEPITEPKTPSLEILNSSILPLRSFPWSSTNESHQLG